MGTMTVDSYQILLALILAVLILTLFKRGT